MMKKLFIWFVIFCSCASINCHAQEKETSQPSPSQMYIGVEVLKPFYWFMKDLGYILEPEFTYQHKGLLYNVAIGYSSINDMIYDDLEYKNTGGYLKFGAGVQLNYNIEKIKKNSFIVGANLVFSSYTETGNVTSDFSFIGNKGESITQNSSARGLETYFTYRRDFDNKIYISISPKIALVLSELNNEKFTTYYVPGFGIVNEDEEYSTTSATPISYSGEATAISLSIKIGYRF